MKTLKLVSTLGAAALLMAGSAFAGGGILPPVAVPFTADYGPAASPEINSWGGATGAFYGGGNPFFQADNALTDNFDYSADAWVISNEALSNQPDFVFFGAFESLKADLASPGIDILQTSTAADLTLQFDASLTSPTAWPHWAVRFEDVDGGAEFNNTTWRLASLEATALSTTPQTYTVTLDQFLGAHGADVDFTCVKTLVWPATDDSATGGPQPGNPPSTNAGGPATFEVGLIIDNVSVSGGNLPADIVLFATE